MNKEELFQQIEAGMDHVFEEESFRKYLKVMGSFHQYSFNNAMLIAMQKPDATCVAGFHDWSRKYHRSVKKGTKAIWIIAPLIHRNRTEEDPEETVLKGFRRAAVFDVSQTYGQPLPDPVLKLLSGTVEDYGQLLEALQLVSRVPVSFEKIDGDAKGFYNPRSRSIVIQKDMPQEQTIKTLVHEMAHALLHGEDDEHSRQMREYEAESTAYAVCEHFGIDSSSYSFPYLALWAKDMNREEKRNAMTRILKAADEIIAGTDAIRYPLSVNVEKKYTITPPGEILRMD